MGKRLLTICRNFGKQMSRKNIGSFAASAAFFLFLSMVPLLIAVCAILPYTALTAENLITALENLLPSVVDSFIEGVVYDIYDRSAGAVTIFGLVTLWSGAKAMLALIRGLNEVNDIEEKRGYLLLRTIACFYTIIMLAAIIVSVFIMVFGNVIVQFLLRDFARLRLLVEFIMHFRFLASWVLLTLIFNLIYSLIPSVKLKFKQQLPGAAFSAVIWSVASYLFSVYVDHYNGFGTYGSLATVVILMLYFYMLMYILLIGAEINRFFGPAYKFLFAWLEKPLHRKTRTPRAIRGGQNERETGTD